MVLIMLGRYETDACILHSTPSWTGKVDVSKKSSRLAIDDGLHTTLLRHQLIDCLWVCLHFSETDLGTVVLVFVGRPETFIIELLISCGSTNSLKGGRVVHVNVW